MISIKSGNFDLNIASEGGKSHTDFAIKAVSDSFDLHKEKDK